MATPTTEQIAEIHASDESNAVLGKRIGLHHKTVEKVRKNGPVRPAISPPSDVVTPAPPVMVRMAENWPTTVYTDGPGDVVQTLACRDGIIPPGWHDNATDCQNYNTCDDTTRFEAFE